MRLVINLDISQFRNAVDGAKILSMIEFGHNEKVDRGNGVSQGCDEVQSIHAMVCAFEQYPVFKD
ncbi:hypothetical protein [Bifidobacterium goeldii]|uniref:hypothetical protein n=1 Tax=Bifidobacterium goeldii TaxID=2306975 RepID=UPI0013DD9574|nr:hypothetical protein [Bifidobacterium goeldii]